MATITTFTQCFHPRSSPLFTKFSPPSEGGVATPILQAEGRGLQAPRGGRTCQQSPTFRSQMGTPRSPGPLPARLEARGSRGWAKGARGGTAQSMFQIPEFEPSEQEDSSSADRGLGPSLCSAPGLLRDLSHPQGLPTSRSHHGGPGAVETRSRHSSYPAGMEEDEGLEEEPSPFRGRSRSAPPNLWAARRYGRELRRMSDEFDGSFKGLPRPKSAGTATQMRQSSSWTRIFQSWWDRNLGRGSAPSQ